MESTMSSWVSLAQFAEPKIAEAERDRPPPAEASPTKDAKIEFFKDTKLEKEHPLASFLMTNFSPPASPSLFSRATSEVSNEQEDRLSSLRLGAPKRASSRSSLASSSRSTTGSSEHADNDLEYNSYPGFVMPSMMVLQPVDHTRFVRTHPEEEEDKPRILILGKSSVDRRSLARLLNSQSPDATLSRSILSEKSTSASQVFSSEIESHYSSVYDLFEELPSPMGRTLFVHPGPRDDHLTNAAEIVNKLSRSLESVESLLNPRYPSTQRLAELASVALKDTLDACLMLFSCPPTAQEVAYSRAVSQAIPLFPVLLVPPPPTSRPQKTCALIEAVVTQLNTAGVKWTPAFETLSTVKHSPLYLVYESSLAKVCAENEEPSTSRSPSPYDSKVALDVRRLRNLLISPSNISRLRRNRAISFLEWREIDLAARGFQIKSLEDWGLSEEDRPISEQECKFTSLEADFSKRVAERRLTIMGERRQGTSSSNVTIEATHVTASFFAQEEMRLKELESIQTSGETCQPEKLSQTVHSPTTPRHYSPHVEMFRSFTQRPDQSTPLERSLASSIVAFESFSSVESLSDTYPNNMVIQMAEDPFHIPSLLQLLGLNLRLYLLPAPAVATGQHFGKKRSSFIGGWFRTAVVVGAIFVAGYVCGAGRDAVAGMRGVV